METPVFGVVGLVKNSIIIHILPKPFHGFFDHLVNRLIVGWHHIKVGVFFSPIHPQGNLPDHQFCFDAPLLAQFDRVPDRLSFPGRVVFIIEVFFLGEGVQGHVPKTGIAPYFS